MRLNNAGHNKRGNPATVFAVAVLLFTLAGFILVAGANLAASRPIEPSDGGMLSSAWRVSQGKRIFNVLDEPPYIFNIHNALFIYLSAAVFNLTGPVLWGPRLLGLVFFAGTAGVVFLFVRRRTDSIGAGLVAGLFVLVERHFFARTALAVCDYPAIFFSVLGLFLWDSSGRRKWLAPLAFALAYFSKQSAVLAPAAVLLALVLSRSWREAARFLATYILAMAAGFALAGLLFGRAYFLNTLFYGVKGTFSIRRGARSLAVTPALYPLAFCTVGWMLARGKGAARLAVPLYAALGAALAFTSGRAGGSRAYSFDLAAALALSAGLAWPRIAGFFAEPSRRVPTLAVAVLFIQMAMVPFGAFSGHDLRAKWMLWKDAPARGVYAARKASFERKGMILSGYTGYDVGTAGRNFTTDPHRLGQLLKTGVLSREPLEAAVEKRTFSAVIIPGRDRGFGIFDQRLKAAVRENYRCTLTLEGEEYYILPQTRPQR
ncbi:MAG: glycosyltransferase family 39 protein [Planctomycetes bacterium]|nr:glycosyltransferase family 39 protein [Planctomycetota bacterium]